MVWKKVSNSDTGTSDLFGGDDVDKISDLFSGVDVDDVTLNVDLEVQKGVVFQEQAAPASPAATKYAVYVDSGDGKLKKKNSAGAVVNLEDTAPSGSAGGDLTGTYPNPTVANDAITYAKIQNVSNTDRLLGRDTAGAGDIEELTASGGIEFTGTGIQTSAFTGDVTKSAGGTSTTIANDAVTNAKAANMAANTIKGNNTSGAADPSDISIGTNTVLGRVAGDIVAAQLATGQIADDAVTYAKIQDVTASDRLLGRDTAAAGVVEELTVSGGIEFTGSGGIQTSAFTGDVTKSAGGTSTTIANDAVTYAKMQNVVNDDRFLGRISGANGDVEELTGTQATTLLDTFTDVLKGLAPASGGGTTTYLRADGTWQTPPGGGGGDNITVNAVAVTDADFDDATPAAPAGGVNVKWQKDASSPANVSAHLAAGDVSNTVLADMAANTIKGNATGSSGDPGDISIGANTVLGRKGGNIVAETIATDQIANDAVTYAKIQNVSATDRLLGRDTAGAGDIEELTVGGGVEFTGTGIQTSAFTGDVTKSAGGTSLTIANDAVTFAKFQNITDARLLGRNAGSSGDMQEITLGGGLAFTSQEVGFDYVDLARTKIGFVEDFFGEPSVTVGGSTGFVKVTSGTGTGTYLTDVTETGVFGMIDLETGTTSSGYSAVSQNPSTLQPYRLGQGATTLECKIKTPSSLSDGTQTYKLLFGFLDVATTSTVNDGVWIEYSSADSANWRYCTANDASRTQTNSGTAVTANTWVRLTIVINADATSAEYFLDGTSLGTINTNLPSAAGDEVAATLGLYKTVGNTERIAYADYIAMQIVLTSSR